MGEKVMGYSEGMSEVSFAGTQCRRLTNGVLELFIPLNVGPRIVCVQFVDGGSNILKTYPDQLESPDSSGFELYGGHRLWTSPEIPGFTDEPDGFPVSIDEIEGGLRVTGALSAAKVEKTIEVSLDGSQVHLRHVLTNRGSETIRIAPWALTVMEEGTLGLTPQAPFAPHSESLLPARPLVLWPYTAMDDPRVRWGRKMIRLQQDASHGPIKYGAWVESGLAGAWRDGVAFIKAFPASSPDLLLDYGCNFETFTREEMLEVESLGAAVDLAPGESVSHPETWAFFQTGAPPEDEHEGREWFDALASQVRPRF
jgi:hypothetical protein